MFHQVTAAVRTPPSLCGATAFWPWKMRHQANLPPCVSPCPPFPLSAEGDFASFEVQSAIEEVVKCPFKDYEPPLKATAFAGVSAAAVPVVPAENVPPVTAEAAAADTAEAVAIAAE